MTMNKARAPSLRQLRVGEEIRHCLAEVFGRGEMHDPALADIILTVTEVRISPDLRSATVFVLPFGGGDFDAALAALGRAAPFLRGRVGKQLRLRYLPTLSFRRDPSFDAATRIDEILRSPDVARDLGETGPADSDRAAPPSEKPGD
jgi:ribosome-binding factor A